MTASSRGDDAEREVTETRGRTARKPPKAPVIVFFLPTLSLGGAERHTLALRSHLAQRGFVCRILVHSYLRSAVMTGIVGDEATFLDLKGMSDPVGWLKVWRALRRLKPDIVVAVNQTPLLISLVERLALATRAKVACIFHTTDLQHYEKYQERLLIKASPFTDLMVYVGENQRRVWEARGIRPRRAEVIRNGIDIAHFEAARAEREAVRQRFGVTEAQLLLGIVAAFRIEKNHVELVAALAEVAGRGIDARVLMVGTGDTRGEVEAMAARLGVADRLIFAGEQADVARFMAACDVGILCSTVETFPLSTIEFLATGVPMISARVGGAPEIVLDGDNGLLYPPGDVARFADAIAALADPARRGALAARAAASVAAFSADRMADRYAATFRSLIGL